MRHAPREIACNSRCGAASSLQPEPTCRLTYLILRAANDGKTNVVSGKYAAPVLLYGMRLLQPLGLGLVGTLLVTASVAAQPGALPTPTPSIEPEPTAQPAATPDLSIPPGDQVTAGPGQPPGYAPASAAPTFAPNAEPVVDQLVRLAEAQLVPEARALVHDVAALRQLVDPSFRNRIAVGIVGSELNYAASAFNMGALYRGTIVRGNIAASALANSHSTTSANIDADVSYELPVCRVVGMRGAIGAERFDNSNHVRGYVEGSACLPSPVIALEVRVGYRFGMRPSLINQGLQIPKEFKGFEIGIDARAYRMLRSTWDADFWAMNLTTGSNYYVDRTQGITASTQFTAAPVSIHRYGRGFGGGTQSHEILRVTLHAESTETGGDSLAVLYEPYRFEGIRLSKRFALSASLGVARGQVNQGDKGKVVITPGGFVAVAFGDLGAFTESRVTYFAQSSNRDVALSELRATQRIVKQADRFYLSGQAWIGRSQLLSITHLSDPALVWGTTVDVMVPVWKGINVYGRGEAARILVPDGNDGVARVVASTGMLGLTYSKQHDFVNHRKPVVDPAWSGPVPEPQTLASPPSMD